MNAIKIISLVFLLILTSSCSELRKGKEALRNQYLEDIPIGTQIEEVFEDLSSEFNLPEPPVIQNKGGCPKNNETRVPGNTIKAYMGWHFDGLLPRYTWTVWCFDKSKKLVDLIVMQETDGP